MSAAVDEAVAVAAAVGIAVDHDGLRARAEEVCRLTGGNISSMLADVGKKKRTEIDFINGAIVTEGKKKGLPVPVNETLTNLIKAVEQTYDRRLPPERLPPN